MYLFIDIIFFQMFTLFILNFLFVLFHVFVLYFWYFDFKNFGMNYNNYELVPISLCAYSESKQF